MQNHILHICSCVRTRTDALRTHTDLPNWNRSKNKRRDLTQPSYRSCSHTGTLVYNLPYVSQLKNLLQLFLLFILTASGQRLALFVRWCCIVYFWWRDTRKKKKIIQSQWLEFPPINNYHNITSRSQPSQPKSRDESEIIAQCHNLAPRSHHPVSLRWRSPAGQLLEVGLGSPPFNELELDWHFNRQTFEIAQFLTFSDDTCGTHAVQILPHSLKTVPQRRGGGSQWRGGRIIELIRRARTLGGRWDCLSQVIRKLVQLWLELHVWCSFEMSLWIAGMIL